MACVLAFLSCDVFAAKITNESSQTIQSSQAQIDAFKDRLFQYNISPLESSSNTATSTGESRDDDLQKLIAQIRSIKVGQEQSNQQAEIVVKQAGQSEPNIAAQGNSPNSVKPDKYRAGETENKEQDLSSAATNESGETSENITDNPSSAVSDRTLRIVDDFLKDPNKSRDLMKTGPGQTSVQYAQLADVLFKSGRFAEAGQCYKKAYELLPADDVNLVGERNWLLFQAGNCLEFDDPNAARDNFAQLLRTDSASPWADVAKFHHDLADWLQKEQPKKLMEEINRKPENNQ